MINRNLFTIVLRMGCMLFPAPLVVLSACSTVGFDNSRIRSLDIEARKYCEEGRRLSGEKRSEEAIKAYGASITIDPSVAAYSGRAGEFAGKGRYDDALADMNSAILLNPRHAPSYFARGNIYFRKTDHERAVRDYNRAISLDPKRAEYCFNAALAYERLGRAGEARKMYEKAVTNDQGYYPAHYNLACMHAVSGDRQKALESLGRAVAAGFSDAARMKVEPALEVLRNSAGFRALLKSIEGKK